ncbi:MAG: hypothetical protein ACRD30_00935 [Bryobacteraceae bacterium]
MAGIASAKALRYAAGGSLIALGLARRSKAGLAMAAAGGGIVSSGLWKHENGASERERHLVRRVITIGRPFDEVRVFFSNPAHLARIMPGVESIHDLGNGRWRWTAHDFEWETGWLETNELSHLHWRTPPGAALRHEAHVHFRHAPGDRGTEVQLLLTWKGAGSLLGHGLAWYASEALRRAKRMIETGELIHAEQLAPRHCL